METKDWKSFKLSDLFDIYSTKDTNILDSQIGPTPYVSASQLNNGVCSLISQVPSQVAGKITVARNGSVGSAFYHSYNFCASPDDVRVFNPKFKMSQNIGIFLSVLIEKEKFRYAYGRKFGTKRMIETSIKLPSQNGSPDWEWIENYVKNILVPKLPRKAKSIWEGSYSTTKSILNKRLNLNTESWKWFRYDEIFEIKKGFYNKKPDEVLNGEIPFIGATDSNNGITSLHDIETIEKSSKTGEEPNASIDEKIFKPNCITVSNNGSIGYAFYQTKPFTCTHDVNPLYLKNHTLNQYIALFLCSLIELEQYRWAYGRKWRPARMPKSKIKLPVDADGQPDWQFMEGYIKGLPYSANL